MLSLLHKYPFLRFQNVCSRRREQLYHGKSKNIECNYYKEWDGTGWELLWKTYLKKLFAEYDKWDKKRRRMFSFTQVKEKYGTLRIYTTGDTRHELIAEMLSGYTCYMCGKQPMENGKHVIWDSVGYILPHCKECAEKYPDETFEKSVLENGFAITQYGNESRFRIEFKEKDGWLEEGEPVRIDDEKKD